MSILHVAQLGHPVLRQIAEPVAEARFDAELRSLAQSMIETMRHYRGVGLAAPQVREGIRMFVAAVGPDPQQPLVVVNPQMEMLTEQTIQVWEGCLSISGYRGPVTRPRQVRLTGQDLEGRPLEVALEGFEAVVAQHEYDHLDGVVYLDRMPDMRDLMSVEEYERWVDAIEKQDAAAGAATGTASG